MPRFIDVDQTLSSAAADDACAAIGAQRVTNVVSFGATGDGTTNDATAIQAALNSATDVHLHFPPGTYRIGAPLLKAGGRLRIDGVGATIKPTNSYTLPGGGAQAGIVGHSDPVETHIDGLVIDGNSTAINGGSEYTDWTNYAHGISVFTQTQAIGDAARVVIRNCHVFNVASVGMNIAGVSNVHVQNNVIEDFEAHGVNISRTSGATAECGYVTGNRIIGRGNLGTSRGGIGILGTKFNKLTIAENVISDMSDTGSKTDGCSSVVYRHNIVTDSGKDGIKVLEHGVSSPGAAIYSVTDAIIDGNIITRINAWRPDGSSLIIVANTTRCVISNNLLVGGGTRVADAIRIINGVGSNYSESADMVITGNVARGALSTGINLSSGDTTSTRSIARLSITGNRFDGRLVLGGGGSTTGDWLVKDNVIALPAGAATVSGYGIAISNMNAKSAAIEGNQIAGHTGGASVSLAYSASAETIRIANNIVRNTNLIAFRVDCNWGVPALVGLIDISHNSLSDPTSGGATITAPWRVTITQMTVRVLKVRGNVIRSNSASGTFSTAGELIGTPATPVGLMIYEGNVYDGAFASIFPGGVTIGTTVTRLLGYAMAGAPAAGTWLRGDRIDNSVPAEAGSSPNKYVITGWRCVTAGTPGTWVQERSLTGN